MWPMINQRFWLNIMGMHRQWTNTAKIRELEDIMNLPGSCERKNEKCGHSASRKAASPQHRWDKAGLGSDTFNVVRSLAPLGQRKVAGAVKYHKIFTQRPCSILVTSYICFMICGLCFNSLLREHPNFGVNQSNCICRSNVAFECFWTAVGYVYMSSNKKKKWWACNRP